MMDLDNRLPVKTNLVRYAIKKDAPFTVQEAYEDLKKIYPNERACSMKLIESWLLNIQGTGYISRGDCYFDGDGELVTSFQVTDYGKACAKYTK